MPHRGLTIESSASTALAVEDEIIQWLSSQADDSTGCVPLYEDPDFAAEVSSLYFDPGKLPDYVPQQSGDSGESAGYVHWYRPTEFTEDPDYFKSSSGCGVLREGLLNDAWLLGVFAAVALHPDNLVENLFVSESLHAFKQFGVFTCRFYKDDNWVPVTTDTRIPYSMELQPEDKACGAFSPPGFALYGSSVNKNEVFIPLLEKAYAKVHGSYQALDEKHGGGVGGNAGTSSGRILEAFLDCTGGSAHRVDLQLERVKQLQFDQATAGNPAAAASSPSSLLWKQLLRYKRKKCILTTQLRQLSFNSHDVTAMGIVKNRQYIIQHVTELGLPSAGASGQGGSGNQQSADEMLRFVKLKTVWGRGMWKGEWSNDDSKWEEHAQIEQAMRSDPRCEFSRSGHDGCFWMLWEDLLDTFTELFVVHVFPPDARQYSVRGDWVGTTAAGAPEVLIEKTRWGWLHDADPNWHRNPQFKLSMNADRSVSGVLLSLTQRDFRLYGGDNYAINFVLLREKLTLATASSNDPPPAIWEFKRSHVVAEAHSYENSAAAIDWSGVAAPATPGTPVTASLSHPTTPMAGVANSGGLSSSSGGSGGQAKTLPERELVKEDVTISPGVAYYLVPYTTNPKVEMEFFLRVVAPQPVRVERVPPIMSVIRTGRWRADGGASSTDANGAPTAGSSSTGEMANAGGPLLMLPLPHAHVAGEENPAWCQNPQFWVRFAERSPRELRRLRKLLSTKAHVTIKVVLRKTSHRASLGNKSRQQREAAKDRANLVGITAVRAAPYISTPPVVVGGSGSSAATQLRAHAKGQKTNFLGEIVDSPFAKATAISEGLIRGTKSRNNQKAERTDVDDLNDDLEAPVQAEVGEVVGNFPTPKLVVKPTEWCRLSSYTSPASACLYLRKVPKEWLLASDSPSVVNSSGGGGLLLVPTLGEPGAEGSFELQVDCDFPLLVDELPKGAGANPKFYLQMQGVRPTKVRITLTRSEREWKSRCQRDSVGTMIGFYLFRGGSGKLMRPGESSADGDSGATTHPIVINGRQWSETDFVPLHTVSSPPELVLSSAAKGGYVIVPATYEPGRLGKFVLSVQCDTEFTLTGDSET
ncbi:calpain-like cysteine protease C2 [Phytophthora sojae]|uniref:Calpain-like cysteine protease C2 n=1 Tax=Phytophthora sojae (strain P6497) TaxID=1094619 RepID=G5A1P8_PHYSP|nr:calpain-like cysteine protease C2 [Phytophthora sojae]EGZ10846.1 calpain-like cysteine protease C2 [Phytophthora sojae]|eukprot:XP_009533591.1 calpain-like cysteine protease C2 [Phytophthora sojae]